MYHNIPSKDRQAILLETLRTLKKGGTFAIHDIFSAGKYGDMHAFVKKLEKMGYEKADFLTLFWFLFIIAMSWNVVDLLVMDWLLVCTVRPAWLIIPGTENCGSYSDYGHHFKGFLIGCVYSTLMALLFAGIDYAILRFVIWG